ncbi:MAG: hypothetical protein VB084_06060 [Syntrophomonadaceae bacterium]|nr:hypothetical protein [Syntrophomonadaceae bacterium]
MAISTVSSNLKWILKIFPGGAKQKPGLEMRREVAHLFVQRLIELVRLFYIKHDFSAADTVCELGLSIYQYAGDELASGERKNS